MQLAHQRVAHAALVHGGERADRAADADHPAAGAGEPVEAVQLVPDVAPERADVGAARPLAGQEALGHPHGPEGAGDHLAEPAPGDLRHLDAAAAEVEHVAVGQGRAVDRAEVAVPGLLLGRQHPHLEAAVDREGRERLLAVGPVAHGARRDRRHVVHAGRVAEGPVEVGRVPGALERVRVQPLRPGARREPHGVADLVNELERSPGAVAEHDQPEGVGAHVDHREAAFGGARVRR